MVSVQQVGQEGLPESQGRDDAAQVASARRRSDKAPQPRLGRMGKVLQVRISVAAVRESEHLRAVSPVQVPQQEEPAAVSAEIRRDLLRRTTETRADSPHKKEIPMTPVSHGKPCAGNPHARFDEGASASEEPRRNALLHQSQCDGGRCARPRIRRRDESPDGDLSLPRTLRALASPGGASTPPTTLRVSSSRRSRKRAYARHEKFLSLTATHRYD